MGAANHEERLGRRLNTTFCEQCIEHPFLIQQDLVRPGNACRFPEFGLKMWLLVSAKQLSTVRMTDLAGLRFTQEGPPSLQDML